MTELLASPAVHAVAAPLVVALVVAAALSRTRLAWLAIVAGYATMIALTTGFGLTPLSMARKVLLLVLLAPLAGLLADAAGAKGRGAVAMLGLAGGAAAVWSASTVLAQRGLPEAMGLGGLVFAFTAALVALSAGLRSNGPAAASAGLGLGIATGAAALLSASIGYFMAGAAIAAASGALLLVQMAAGRAIAPGLTGTLSVGLAAAVTASASLMTAQLPWYALPLMLLVPFAASFDPGAKRPILLRIALSAAASTGAAALPVLAAWWAAHAR